MITELNAPLPGTQPETFWNLVCGSNALPKDNLEGWLDSQRISWYMDRIYYKAWGKVAGRIKGPVKPNPYESRDCYRLLSTPSQTFVQRSNYQNTRLIPNTYLLSRLVSIYFSIKTKEFEIKELNRYPEILLLKPGHYTSVLPKDLRVSSNPAPKYLVKVMNDANERELAECGKSVLISDSARIATEYDFMSRGYGWKGKKFRVGKDLLGPNWVTWKFYNCRGKIPGYFKSIWESGIWDRLEIEIGARRIRGRKVVGTTEEGNREDNVSQTISSGLVTLFILCGWVLVAAVGCVVTECRHVISVWVCRCVWFITNRWIKAKIKFCKKGRKQKPFSRCGLLNDYLIPHSIVVGGSKRNDFQTHSHK